MKIEIAYREWTWKMAGPGIFLKVFATSTRLHAGSDELRPELESQIRLTTEFRMVHGVLVRTITRPDGGSYQHSCTLESFADVVRFIEEHAAVGVTTNELWDRLDEVPCTQATVALELVSRTPRPRVSELVASTYQPLLFDSS